MLDRQCQIQLNIDEIHENWTEHTEQTTQNSKNFYAHEKLTLLTKDNQNNNAQAFIKDINKRYIGA